MTVDEALRERAAIIGNLNRHKANAAASVTYETKKTPAFTFQAELTDVDTCVKVLIRLEAMIGFTNAQTFLEFNGKKISLTEATVMAREMKGALTWLGSLISRDQTKTFEPSPHSYHAETQLPDIEYTCALPTKEKQDAMVRRQAELAALNAAINRKNFETTLIALP